MRPIDILDSAKIARQRADIFNRYDGASMPNDFVLHTVEPLYPTGNDALSQSLREIFFKHHGDDWANEPELYENRFPFYEPLEDLLAEEARIADAVMRMTENPTHQAKREFSEQITRQIEKLQRGDEMPPPKSAYAELNRLKASINDLRRMIQGDE
jgi:hypothetical protein